MVASIQREERTYLTSCLHNIRFRGRWFIPYGIPYPKKIQVVIGSAIDIPCLGNDVSRDMIDKYHGIFLKEMEALFERHKRDAGYGDSHLKIC
jgi:2-acylglycerol O-acyltransferase 2